VSFLVGQRLFGDSPSTNDPGGAPATDFEGKKLDGEILSGPIPILLTYTDFDTPKVPVRNSEGGTTDLYYWHFENEISAPYGLAKWTGAGKPSQSQCATLIATHGVGSHLPFELKDYFCLKTNQARITMFQVTKDSTTTGWEIEATTWKQRLTAE
jgi:hypothetical protein